MKAEKKHNKRKAAASGDGDKPANGKKGKAKKNQNKNKKASKGKARKNTRRGIKSGRKSKSLQKMRKMKNGLKRKENTSAEMAQDGPIDPAGSHAAAELLSSSAAVEAATELNLPDSKEIASSSDGPIRKEPTTSRTNRKRTKSKECCGKTRRNGGAKKGQGDKEKEKTGKQKKGTSNTSLGLLDREKILGEINRVLEECGETECLHPDFDMTVPSKDFQLTSYWTRDAVGVKASRDLLPWKKPQKESKKPSKNGKANAKKWKSQNFSQIAYFSAGGCFYVNYLLGQAFVIGMH